MESRGKTLFIDIDGTIFTHQSDGSGANFAPTYAVSNLLDNVKYYFNLWHGKGYRLILTTGRTESMRERTEDQLRSAGLFWDTLLMGCGGGQRILINDISPVNPLQPKAIAINLPRNDGFTDINKLYNTAMKVAGAPDDKEYTI